MCTCVGAKSKDFRSRVKPRVQRPKGWSCGHAMNWAGVSESPAPPPAAPQYTVALPAGGWLLTRFPVGDDSDSWQGRLTVRPGMGALTFSLAVTRSFRVTASKHHWQRQLWRLLRLGPGSRSWSFRCLLVIGRFVLRSLSRGRDGPGRDRDQLKGPGCSTTLRLFNYSPTTLQRLSCRRLSGRTRVVQVALESWIAGPGSLNVRGSKSKNRGFNYF